MPPFPNLRPDFSYEEKYPGPVAGVDEAGCGPWAGPVIAGAVILVPGGFAENFLIQLHDSKKLTPKKRETIFRILEEANGDACHFSIGRAEPEEIDCLNIRQATLKAMERAVAKLSLQPKFILVDGTLRPSFPCGSSSLIKGDQLSRSIAAASIIAKVTRDRWMCDLSQRYPGYGWHLNKGYGTRSHHEALEHLGVTDHHRKSFAPVAKIMFREFKAAGLSCSTPA